MITHNTPKNVETATNKIWHRLGTFERSGVEYDESDFQNIAHQEITALLTELERQVEGKRCDERKTKYFGEIETGCYEAASYNEKQLVNAALQEILTIIKELKGV